MVMNPRSLVPDRSGLNAGDNQAIAMRFGPAPVSLRFGSCKDAAVVKLSVPVNAGAGLLAMISTPKASVPILTPSFRVNVTGIWKAVPGDPVPPVGDTVP